MKQHTKKCIICRQNKVIFRTKSFNDKITFKVEILAKKTVGEINYCKDCSIYIQNKIIERTLKWKMLES